jgi:hypothetical protein
MKAWLPMLWTLLPIRLVNEPQSENASAPMLVTLLGIVTLATAVSMNALFVMLVTNWLLIMLGTVTALPEPVYCMMVMMPLLVAIVNCASTAAGLIQSIVASRIV